MLLLSHVGITLGAAVLLNGICVKTGILPPQVKESEVQYDISPEAQLVPENPRRKKFPWFDLLARYVDMRILIVGSLLPDIIDKPIGIAFFPDSFGSGRVFCHTLLFVIIITLGGLYLYKRWNKTWLLVLSFGSFMHLLLDRIWRAPATLFWPFLGLNFETEDLTYWTTRLLYSLIRNPEILIPELIGAAILIWFAVMLIFRKKSLAFLKYGHI